MLHIDRGESLFRLAPQDIPRYPLHLASDVVGLPMVIAGYGVTGDGESGAIPALDLQPTKRAGLNRYELLRDDEPFPGLDLLTYDFDSGKPEDDSVDGNRSL